MTYKAWLFDLDGTLLDTAPDLGLALNHVLNEHDLPPCPLSVSQHHSSDGALGLLKVGFGNELARYDIAILRQMFLDYYHQNLCKETRLYPHIETLLNRLNQHNLPWGIVTNKPTYLTEQLLPSFPCFEHSQVLICGDTFDVRKPDPKVMHIAANALNIEAESCIYVGDAERDMQAANAAGMFSVLAHYGYIKPNDTPHLWQANHQVSDVSELFSLLG